MSANIYSGQLTRRFFSAFREQPLQPGTPRKFEAHSSNNNKLNAALAANNFRVATQPGTRLSKTEGPCNYHGLEIL